MSNPTLKIRIRISMVLRLFSTATVFVFLMILSGPAPYAAPVPLQHPALPFTGDFGALPFLSVKDTKAKLGKGKFLVAGRNLKAPSFSETVVLLIDYNKRGAMGVIINRPTTLPLSKVLPEIKESQKRNDTVYFGGPVEVSRILMLMQSADPSKDSMQVFNDVYISGSYAVLQQMVDGATADERFRIYAGYAGWAAGQLDAEVSRGDWHIVAADAKTVFELEPSKVWPELIIRASAKWAKAGITHVPTPK
jgi:putative transcriptional regulator